MMSRLDAPLFSRRGENIARIENALVVRTLKLKATCILNKHPQSCEAMKLRLPCKVEAALTRVPSVDTRVKGKARSS